MEQKYLDSLGAQMKDLDLTHLEMFEGDNPSDARFLKHRVFFDLFRNTGRAKIPAVCE